MLDRQVAPPVQPLASVILPAADVLSLPNGARLHILRNDAQPVIRLQIVFPAGKWYEPQLGVSLLAARMLLEGTSSRTARQIADTVAFYGASLECEQGFDRTALTLYCLTRHIEVLLPLVQDVATEATFPTTEFELLKSRTVQNVRIERQKTSYLAAERFSHNLFGNSYPYGVTFDENSFKKLTPDIVKAFYRTFYQIGSAEIFLCGDISDRHEQLVARAFGQGSADHQESAEQDEPHILTVAQHDYVTVEQSLQASLRIGRLWPSPTHPDAHHLQVLVKVLGGYFGSRLMKNIREDKGFTYGIYSSIAPREHASMFVIGTDVNAASAEAAIEEVHNELRRLQDESIPIEELQTVKTYMAGKFANELSTVFEQCDKYKTVVLLGLPNTHYSDFLRQINLVSSDELQQLAQTYLSPENMIEVVAGPVK
ncbi:peptidase M16 domain protein [Hymenobacter roseosalivarius DSM 11622]|uniref:Peptidase M16 domain protein n=1 Tax=Hymenobacter roseosalivarius DSM 11622 TaxID=645990 RepID=A0A1W1V247_9BACT|nr:pitrilysin family protein [Hymenobacter roseosalivarius]SMB87393.1 peptidase M16 domain protein [Hymenobacter roseosalivarius DSM 11622]